MAKPLIGITTSELRTPDRVDPLPDGEPPNREFALGFEYPMAVRAAGGVPVVLPPQQEGVDELYDHLDGLVLSGGPDLDPALYAEPPHPELGPVEPATDRWEMSLLHGALQRDLPILGICRGMQLLNVAAGGSLWQDIPSQLGALGHRQKQRGRVTTHQVEVEPGTQLAALVGSGQLAVNSFHHQAVRRLGLGMVVSARDGHGLIEGIEDPSRRFAVGVQWHAESLHRQEPHHALFAALVEAARERSGIRSAA